MALYAPVLVAPPRALARAVAGLCEGWRRRQTAQAWLDDASARDGPS